MRAGAAMGTGVSDRRASGVTTEGSREALASLLEETRFHATDRQKDILRYLAERRLSGCDDSVKAYAIAIDVLGRPSNFDPSTDPIVRIEMSRLRTAVSNFYEAFGSEGQISVDLPKGRYVAEFTRTLVPLDAEQADPSEEEQCPEVAVAAPDMPGKTGAMGLRRIASLAAGGGLAVTAAAVALFYWQQPELTDRPIVAITMQAADDDLRGEASQTRDMLLTALTQFQTLTIAATDTVAKPSTANLYHVDMKYYADGDDRSVWWQVVDSGGGRVLKSGVEHVETAGKTPVVAKTELVGDLTRQFATTRGVINNIEMHDTSETALGNSCILRAEYMLDEGGPGDLAKSVACLERTLKARPQDADALATLSRILLAPSGADVGAATKENAVVLANRAVSLAPTSDRAQVALMAAQFASGRTDAAISAGNRALALNPNNPDVSAKLGLVLYSLGFWDAGQALAEDAGRAGDAVPRDAQVVLALDAYRKSDWSEASLLSEQINYGDDLVRAVRAASLGQLGSDQAKGRLADLRAASPDFERHLKSRLAARGISMVITASLEDGLTKAGASFVEDKIAVAN